MLKKLLKYDFEYIYKVLIIFYILSIFFSVVTRILFLVENSFIINIIASICSGVTISMIFNILINNLMRLWVRFKSNFYGDESYLTHTLPIDKKTLYMSKIMCAFITLFLSVIVIGLTLFIAYYSKENIELLKNFLFPIANMYDSSITGILLLFLLVFFLEFLNGLQTGYTGIIIGHKMNNFKIGLSVFYGFCVYTISQVFGLFVLFITGLFDKDIMNLFYTNDIINVNTIKLIIYLSIIVYSLIIIINYFINLHLLKKGVNVD